MPGYALHGPTVTGGLDLELARGVVRLSIEGRGGLALLQWPRRIEAPTRNGVFAGGEARLAFRLVRRLYLSLAYQEQHAFISAPGPSHDVARWATAGLAFVHGARISKPRNDNCRTPMNTAPHLRRIAFTSAAALSLLLGCGPKSGASATPAEGGGDASSASQGSPAPEFELPDLSGQTVRLADYRGQVVVVDFWASWCSPCKEELPVLEELYQKYRGDGLTIVGVNLDEEAEDAKGFLESTGVTFPVGLDPEGAIADKYAPPKMPTSYIIDPEGNIVHVQAGYEADDAAIIEEKIVALLGK